MCNCLPKVILALCLAAAPLHGQLCRKVPPPFLPGLFPEAILGMSLQFTTDPSGACAGWYRPATAEERAARPWAMVTIEPNEDPVLGEDADAVRALTLAPTYTLLTMGEWPALVRPTNLGQEFAVIKGPVRVVVLVKNGDNGAASQALAQALFEAILPRVPCG